MAIIFFTILSSLFVTAQQQPTRITSCGATINSDTEYVLDITMDGSYHSPCVVVQSVSNVVFSGSIQCASICQIPAMSLSGSSSISVLSTNITGFMFGIDITAKSPSDSYTIFNNNISASLIAISCTGNPSISITNNTISASAGGILSDVGSSAFRGSTVNISDNAITSTGSSRFLGISVHVPSPQPVTIDFNVISGQYPTLSHSDVTGIYVQNIVRGSVSHNTIKNFGVNTFPFQLSGINIDTGCISINLEGNKITSLFSFPNATGSSLQGITVAGSANNFVSNSIGMLSVTSTYPAGAVFDGADVSGFLVSGYGNYFDMNALDNIKAGDANGIAGDAIGFTVSGVKTTISYSTIIGLQAGMLLDTNSSTAKKGRMIGVLVEGTNDIIISGNYLSSDYFDNVVFSGVNNTCPDGVNIECYPGNTCCVGCRVSPSGTVCGEVGGECQLLPTCDGVSATCPQGIEYKPAGTECELTAETRKGYNPPSGQCMGTSSLCFPLKYALMKSVPISLDMPLDVSFNFFHSYNFGTAPRSLLFKFSASSEKELDYTLIATPNLRLYRASASSVNTILTGCPFTSSSSGDVSISTTFNTADGTASLELDYLDATIPPNTDVTLNWIAEGNNYFVYYPMSVQPISFSLNGSVDNFALADQTCNVISGTGRSSSNFTIAPTNTDPIYFWLRSSEARSSTIIRISQAEMDPNKVKRTVVLQSDNIAHELITATDSVQFLFSVTATQTPSIYLSVKTPLMLSYDGATTIFSSSSYVQLVAPSDKSTTCPQLTTNNTISFTLSQISGQESSIPIYTSVSTSVIGDTKITDAMRSRKIYTESTGSSRFYVFSPSPISGSCAGSYHAIVSGDLAGADYGISCDNLTSEFNYLPSLNSRTATITTQTCEPIIVELKTRQRQDSRSRSPSVSELSMQITNSKYIYCGDNICQMQLGEDSTTCPSDCTNGEVLVEEDKKNMKCGDGTCQSVLGENCGTCSIDCGAAPCLVCGDGVCDMNEDCSSCYTDCGPCNNKADEQCQQCNSTNSVCGSNGQCICSGVFSGTTCSIETKEVVPIMDQQRPAAYITIPSSPNISFEISTTALEERTSIGELVSRLIVPGLSFSFDSRPDDSDSFFATYTSTLDNGATLIIKMEYYATQRTIDSIGGAISIPSQTVLASVEVNKWPFASVRNIFGITLGAFGISESVDTCSYVTDSIDQSGNLRWMKIVRNGITLYSQYNEKTMMDGLIKRANYKRVSGNNNEVIAVVPSFFSSSRIEIRYTVINDTEISNTTAEICGVQSSLPIPTERQEDINEQQHPGSIGMSTGITVGIVAGILGAVIIGAVVAAVIITKRNKKKSKILTRRMATVASLRTGKPHKPENTTENPLHRPATFTEIKL